MKVSSGQLVVDQVQIAILDLLALAQLFPRQLAVFRLGRMRHWPISSRPLAASGSGSDKVRCSVGRLLRISQPVHVRSLVRTIGNVRVMQSNMQNVNAESESRMQNLNAEKIHVKDRCV